MRKLLLTFFAFLVLFVSNGMSQPSVTKVTDGPPYTGDALEKYCSNPKKLLVIETKQGIMKIQLFDKVAPNHVKQITDLAEDGKYNGTTFHRIVRGFMIQGGDPNSKDDDPSNDGQGGMGEKLKAEFSDIPHVRGICSMARTNDPNSATSQFFICDGNASFLNHQYTVWGQLVSGYNVLDKIVDLDMIPKYKKSPEGSINPGKDAEMTKVYIEEKGKKVKKPKKGED